MESNNVTNNKGTDLFQKDLPVNYEVLSSITLTPKEENIFSFMMEVLKIHNKSTTLRVSGGWVRDKFMG